MRQVMKLVMPLTGGEAEAWTDMVKDVWHDAYTSMPDLMAKEGHTLVVVDGFYDVHNVIVSADWSLAEWDKYVEDLKAICWAYFDEVVAFKPMDV